MTQRNFLYTTFFILLNIYVHCNEKIYLIVQLVKIYDKWSDEEIQSSFKKAKELLEKKNISLIAKGKNKIYKAGEASCKSRAKTPLCIYYVNTLYLGMGLADATNKKNNIYINDVTELLCVSKENDTISTQNLLKNLFQLLHLHVENEDNLIQQILEYSPLNIDYPFKNLIDRYITNFCYYDEKAILYKTDRKPDTFQSLIDLIRENVNLTKRAPLNLNINNNELFETIIRINLLNLKGYYYEMKNSSIDINKLVTYTDIFNMYNRNNNEPYLYSKEITLSEQTIRKFITKIVETGNSKEINKPLFNRWSEYKNFLDKIGKSDKISQQELDLIWANTYPGLHSSKLNTDSPLNFRIDKQDIIYPTTEFTIFNSGIYKIHSHSSIVNGKNDVLAQSSILTYVKISEVISDTLFDEFSNGKIEPVNINEVENKKPIIIGPYINNNKFTNLKLLNGFILPSTYVLKDRIKDVLKLYNSSEKLTYFNLNNLTDDELKKFFEIKPLSVYDGIFSDMVYKLVLKPQKLIKIQTNNDKNNCGNVIFDGMADTGKESEGCFEEQFDEHEEADKLFDNSCDKSYTYTIHFWFKGNNFYGQHETTFSIYNLSKESSYKIINTPHLFNQIFYTRNNENAFYFVFNSPKSILPLVFKNNHNLTSGEWISLGFQLNTNNITKLKKLFSLYINGDSNTRIHNLLLSTLNTKIFPSLPNTYDFTNENNLSIGTNSKYTKFNLPAQGTIDELIIYNSTVTSDFFKKLHILGRYNNRTNGTFKSKIFNKIGFIGAHLINGYNNFKADIKIKDKNGNSLEKFTPSDWHYVLTFIMQNKDEDKYKPPIIDGIYFSLLPPRIEILSYNEIY